MKPENSDRHWATSLVDRATARLRAAEVAQGHGRLFEDLKSYLGRECIDGERDALAKKHRLPPHVIATEVERLRARFRQAIEDQARSSER